MKESTVAPTSLTPTHAALRLGDRCLRHIVFGRLQRLQRGQLTVIDAQGNHTFGRLSAEYPLHAKLTVHDPNLYSRLAYRGSIGVGESYMEGEWTTDDLTLLIRLFAINRHVVTGLERGLVRPAMQLFRLFHRLRHNTRDNSRSNIAAHYDLGNGFYRLFLDDTMMYSSAIFPGPDSSLFEASVTKIDRICRKLGLQPSDHLLEIGTGWGGFALHAAQQYGCRVTTTTISQEQYALARERVAAAGMADRIEVLQKDYRDLDGEYDKLVSIEMIEAVGHRFFDVYFSTCSRLLKPGGMMLLQTITIPDQEYERYRREVDFIQRYIFPGGCLPSIEVICRSIAGNTDLRLSHLEEIGDHYAKTLRFWRDRFFDNLDKVRELGFSDTFIRMWEFYLCYCEGGFTERAIGTAQLLFSKPYCRDHYPLGRLEH